MHKMLPTWDTADVESLLPFARIKLVVADLDGTLVQAQSSHVFKMIQHLSKTLTDKNRLNFTIATGRAFNGIFPLLQTLRLKADIPLILYNGSIIIKNKTYRLISKMVIPFDTVLEIVESCLEYNVVLLAYCYREESLSWGSDQPNFEAVYGWAKNIPFANEINKIPVTWMESKKISEQPSAILIDVSQVTPCAISEIVEKLSQINNITLTSSGSAFLEIRPKGSDKAKALQLVSGQIGIKQNEVLALGDNDNDVEMLQWSGIGVTVSNASLSAVSSCNFICTHSGASGAVEVLRLLKEAKRLCKDTLSKEAECHKS